MSIFTTLVAAAPSPATTGLSLDVTAGDGAQLPDPALVDPYYMIVWPITDAVPVAGSFEVFDVQAITGDTLTIGTRGINTSKRAIVVGDQLQIIRDLPVGPDGMLSITHHAADRVVSATTSATADFLDGVTYNDGQTDAQLRVTAFFPALVFAGGATKITFVVYHDSVEKGTMGVFTVQQAAFLSRVFKASGVKNIDVHAFVDAGTVTIKIGNGLAGNYLQSYVLLEKLHTSPSTVI